MSSQNSEKVLASFLFFGSIFSTIFLLTGPVTDPVNATKMAAVGALGFGSFLIVIIRLRGRILSDFKPFLWTIGLFVLAMVNAIAGSAGPLVQNLYGVYGRNTGFVFYLSLSLLTIATSALRSQSNFDKLLKALFVAGIINVFYCGWVLLFGDFIGWTNPYRKILGLFGNPDFISAFLGLFATALVGYCLAPKISWKFRALGLVIFLVSVIEIKMSHAIQGLVLTGTGLAIVGFYWIRSRFGGRIITFAYSLVILGVGSFALAGALQHGPLAKYIYKISVSLRGQYWQAGINMGNAHPFTGIGMDTYGDWYMSERTEYAATTLPGSGTVTNVAHNVVIDFFSSGGWPLLITYLATLTFGVIAIVRVTLRGKSYDGIFVAITTAWMGYQLQSIISINQAGLAIWGWLLLGALVAYEYSTRDSSQAGTEPIKQASKKINSLSTQSVISPQLVGGIGLAIGLILAIPPLSADMAWKSALDSQKLPKIESALQPSYLRPSDSYRYALAVDLLVQSNLPEQAHKYAKIAVKFNPNYFTAWEQLYKLPNASEIEKQIALSNMHRIDPYSKESIK